jgi:hypothetical protein
MVNLKKFLLHLGSVWEKGKGKRERAGCLTQVSESIEIRLKREKGSVSMGS